MRTEMKPCPFCGGEGYYAKGVDSGLYMGGCLNKECRGYVMNDIKRGRPEEAIEAWNKRAGETFNGEVMLMGDRVYLAGKGYFTKEER